MQREQPVVERSADLEATNQALQQEVEERKRAEKTLREQREWFRVTLASVGDGVIAADMAGRVTFINRVAQLMTRWRQEEALGQPLEKVFPVISQKTRQPAPDPIKRVLDEGTLFGLNVQSVLVARDGTEIPIEDSAAPIRQEPGTVVGVVVVFRDATERRRAEAVRARLAAIVKFSEDAIIGLSLDGTIESWNPGAQRLYGYAAGEVYGKPISLLVPPDRQEELPDAVDRLRRGERIAPYETVRLRKDGSRVDVSVSLSPIRDADGDVTGAAMIVRDITARKRAEQERAGLLAREQQARAEAEAVAGRARFLAEASRVLASSLDYETTLAGVTRLAVPCIADWCVVELLNTDGSVTPLALAHGDPAKVELAWGWRRRFPPDMAAPHGLGNVLRTGQSELYPDVASQMVAASAEEPERLRLPLDLGLKSVMLVPLTARGKTLGAICLITAESGRHYGPDDLALAEDLARRAAVAIDNAQLYRELREADSRKDQFLAMLAHELRNPLAPVLNSLHILRLPDIEAEAAEKVRSMIERQVRHLARLVDDLLDVTRIARGKIQVHRDRLDLARLVRTTVHDYRPTLESAGLGLTVQTPEAPVCVTGDATRLAQVLTNLLENSRKFTDAGGRVEVRVWADEARERAALAVRDTGIGIDPDMLPRVFDIFSQADRSLDRSRGGLGLGLAFVKGLVELHGGEVHASSDGPGRGTEFTVLLPLEKEPAALASDPEFVLPSAQRLRVLVVEDNPDAAESLRILLRLMGHEVRLAATGPDGVRAAAEWLPDIVLCDVGLPGLDGFEVAREIRRNPAMARARLIAVTGYGVDAERFAQAGFDHALTKPADPAVLEQLLRPAPFSEK